MFCNFGNVRSSSAAQDPSPINSKKSSSRRHLFVPHINPVPDDSHASLDFEGSGSHEFKATASVSVHSESGWCMFILIKPERLTDTDSILAPR